MAELEENNYRSECIPLLLANPVLSGSIKDLLINVLIPGERGSRGEKGEVGVGQRGEIGPAGPIGKVPCKTVGTFIHDRYHCVTLYPPWVGMPSANVSESL